jgi:hypothetical protein
MAIRSGREPAGPLFGDVPDAVPPAPAEAGLNPSTVGRTNVNKLIASVVGLCLLVAAAPATSIALDHSPGDVHAAKSKNKKKRKKAKKKPRYRISINFEAKSVSIKECNGTTTHDRWRTKETHTSTTKWSQTGFYPGSSRRTGYTEGLIVMESTDPYIPSDRQPIPRREIEATFGKSDWDLQINKKRTKFSYDWKDADGRIRDIVIQAPRKPGKSVTKKLNGFNRKAGDPGPNDNCFAYIDDFVSTEVIIKRVE